MATTTQKLTQVQAAIDKIESGGQAYTADGRTMSRADLKTLYAERARLEVMLRREARGGAVSYIVPI